MRIEDTKITYSKPILSRAEFIRESGYNRNLIDRALHSKYAEQFVIRTSNAKNAKFLIDTKEFEYLRRQGCFR